MNEKIIAGTKLEKMLAEIIYDLGFDAEWQVKVGKYILDLYVREFHLGFEADGPQHLAAWHRRRDEERDHWLENTMGIPVFRASENDLENNPDLVEEYIESFIELYADSVYHRKSLAAGYWI